MKSFLNYLKNLFKIMKKRIKDNLVIPKLPKLKQIKLKINSINIEIQSIQKANLLGPEPYKS